MKAIILAAIIGASVLHPAPEPIEPPDDQDLKLPPVAEQDFCCADTWKDEDGHHGSSCETIGADLVRVCINGGGKVLHCSGDWSGGKDVDC
jgi:hypothetical protein